MGRRRPGERGTRAAELASGNVAVRASLGNLFWRHDRREAAIAAWREGLASAADTPGLLFILGLAWFETGAPERGRPLLARFLAVAPPEAEQQRTAAAQARNATWSPRE